MSVSLFPHSSAIPTKNLSSTHLEPVESTPEEVAVHSLNQHPPSLFRRSVEYIANKVNRIWNCIYYSESIQSIIILCKCAIRSYENPEGWAAVKEELNNPESNNYVLIEKYKAFIQDPVEDILAPEIGMDSRIHPHHLQASFYQEPEIPVAPDEDIAQLSDFYDRFVTQDHPDLIDDDTEGTFEEFREGIAKMIEMVQGDEDYGFDSSNVPDLLKHLCHFLKRSDISQHMKAACLIELAKGGHRGCPTRIMEGSLRYYQLFSGTMEVLTFPQMIGKILHDARLGIFREKSRLHPHPEDIQVYQEYILSLRNYLGISESIPAFNGHLLLTFELTPKKSLPDFFQTYTSEFVIDLMTNALNGHPIANRPLHERAAKQIPTSTAYQWFAENPLPSDEEFMAPETNTFTNAAILHLLRKLEIIHD